MYAHISTGLSHVEKNRFSAMKIFIQRLRAPECQVQTGKPGQKSVELFSLQYTYPKCLQPKEIKGKSITSSMVFFYYQLGPFHQVFNHII